MDEAGYTANWESDKDAQPYFCLAGFMCEADKYVELCNEAKEFVESLGLEHQEDPIGRGFELKGSALIRGAKFWKQNQELRDKVVAFMFEVLAREHCDAFVTYLDKQKYYRTECPYSRSYRWLAERIQGALRYHSDYGFVIYDQNYVLEKTMTADTARLAVSGSSFMRFNHDWGGYETGVLATDRIMGFASTNSRYTFGINIADLIAACAYQHFVNRMESPDPDWSMLHPNLYQYDGRTDGWGLKEVF